MIETKLSPERKRERTKGNHRPPPVHERAWTAVDWLIVCAIFACAVLLAKVIA